MATSEPRTDREGPLVTVESPQVMRLVLLAAIVTSVIVALMVAIPWLRVLTPRWLIRGATIAYLWSLLAVCALAAPAVLIGGVWSLLAAARSWRQNDRAALRRTLRWVVLASSGLVG